MAGVDQVTKTGPKTFTPAEVILGGQLVEARTGGRIGVAAAASVKVLGVALSDAQSPDTAAAPPTADQFGRPIVNALPIATSVAVAYGGAEVRLTYSAAATFGALLVSTGAGKVGPAAAAADAALIVGRCTEPAGVATGKTGLVRLV